MIADRREHSLDLMIPALVDADNGKTGRDLFAFGRLTDDFACALADRNAICKARLCVRRKRLAEFCKVIFHNMVFRGEHSVGKLTVIGDEEQTCCVDVEPAAGGKLRQTVVRAQQIEDSFLLCVLRCGDDTLGLVQQKVVMFRENKWFSREGDLVFFREHRVVGLFHDDAVHGNASLPNRRLCVLAGEGGLFGEKSVKAHKMLPFEESRTRFPHRMR